MFSNSVRWKVALAALTCSLGFAGAAAAQTIVVSASGPSARSYPAGKSLAAGSRIVLAAGDTLTVLDSRGTRTLRGPVTTSAAASATTANPSFAALVATQNRRRARTGAIRGAGESAKPSNLWYVNVASEGTVCVTDPAAVGLWRPDMEQAETLTIAPASGGSASAPFLVGQNVATWPASLPIAEGASYVISGGGLTKPTRVRFALLPAAPGDPAGTYAALDAKGCDAQKQLLLGALKSPN
ncbi:MAG: hypothetical protein EOO76_08780 [Novosphingobium sp.]|nr:MAG: hypothetical protein EOO76_08780 [Novosphingobium sp.]